MSDVDDLLARLTLDQKVRLLTGADEWGLHDEPAVGLRRMVLSDGPSGIRGERWDERDTATNLPSATALGATWDPSTARRYGEVLAAEARRKGSDVVLGPTINLHRSPLGGRHFEAYSEDPVLTSRLAAAYVEGVQRGGVAACPKHYLANDFETERFTADVRVNEKTLRELYLAAFEDTVRSVRPWAVMAAYNSVNGATMTENPLLAEPLCGEWGFDGVVVSDWWATRSTVPAAQSRLDLVMPGPEGPWGDALVAAVREGKVDEAVVDEKVRRLLVLARRVGALGSSEPAGQPYAGLTEEAAAAFARETAADGTVLVRNDGELPWDGDQRPGSVAVIGHNALLARSQGGGSAAVVPPYVVSPLAGLRAALPDAEITWTLGAVAQPGLVPLAAEDLTDPVSGDLGVRVRMFDEAGRVILDENRRTAELAHLGSARTRRAVRLEVRTTHRPRESGLVSIGAAFAGRGRLTVDGAVVVDADLVHTGGSFGGGLVSPPFRTAPVDLEAGRAVDLVVDLALPARENDGDGLTLVLGVDPAADATAEELVATAVAAARAAEVAVVVVGTSDEVESEGFDRTSLALPGEQDRLVGAVAAVNPRTVVVVNAGSPVTMPWNDEVAAILLTWFGGQEYGNALADVILGTVEPGGRLPTTWGAVEADVPILATAPVDGIVAYEEGIHIGYRAWLRAGRTPAYPFGFGLGYTTWGVSDLRVTGGAAEGSVIAGLRVRNTGGRAGKHVVQAYLSRAETTVDRPARWLAGSAVVRLEPEATEDVRISIDRAPSSTGTRPPADGRSSGPVHRPRRLRRPCDPAHRGHRHRLIHRSDERYTCELDPSVSPPSWRGPTALTTARRAGAADVGTSEEGDVRKVAVHRDVVVIGGGLAGVCAAIAAARFGSRWR